MVMVRVRARAMARVRFAVCSLGFSFKEYSHATSVSILCERELRLCLIYTLDEALRWYG